MKHILLITSALLFYCCTAGKTITNENISDADQIESSDIASDEMEIPDVEEELMKEEHLLAGISEKILPVPLGISTAGYGQTKDSDSPKSPFSDIFTATTKIHSLPRVKTLAFSRGKSEFFIVRVDLAGIFSEMLDEIMKKAFEKYGMDLKGKLIIAGNHTHAGPARLFRNIMAMAVSDSFFPEFYEKFTDTMVESIIEAQNNLHEARIGFASTENSLIHDDIRCQNPPLKDPTMNVVAVADENEIFALIVNFPVHGTVLDYKDHALSGDAPGMIEMKTEEIFDHPVSVFFLQSWAGDMAPADPVKDYSEKTGIPLKHMRLEAIGTSAAETILESLKNINYFEDKQAEISILTKRLYVSPEIIGYGTDEFPYPDGAFFCGASSPAPCYGEGGNPPDMSCLPLPPGDLIHDAVVTVAKIGNILFMTLPGEPVTQTGLNLKKKALEIMPDANVLILGYAQTHLGYILPEDDFMAGGYEPTVSLWGWKFHDFIINASSAVLHKMVDPEFKFDYKEMDEIKYDPVSYEPYIPMKSSSEPQIITNIDSDYHFNDGDVISLDFSGGDPWIGSPYFVLEGRKSEAQKDFVPCALQNTAVFDSTWYFFSTELTVSPPYNENADKRTFSYHVNLPVREIIESMKTEYADYRISVSGKYISSKDQEIKGYSLNSDSFKID